MVIRFKCLLYTNDIQITAPSSGRGGNESESVGVGLQRANINTVRRSSGRLGLGKARPRQDTRRPPGSRLVAERGAGRGSPSWLVGAGAGAGPEPRETYLEVGPQWRAAAAADGIRDHNYNKEGIINQFFVTFMFKRAARARGGGGEGWRGGGAKKSSGRGVDRAWGRQVARRLLNRARRRPLSGPLKGIATIIE